MKTISASWIYKNLQSSNQINSQASLTVQPIIRDIQKHGDKALLKYVQKFENSNAQLSDLVISKKKIS